MEGKTKEMWWRWWWCWRENNRNLVAVVLYSFTIHEAVLKKLSVGSMWGRCGVDARSM